MRRARRAPPDTGRQDGGMGAARGIAKYLGLSVLSGLFVAGALIGYGAALVTFVR